ncbi:hypothetical protein [Sinorhizobium psoraleae]|uniref:Uncharacterized protein n=1 Tax=Sinorhizobium psoraleae TaxID=520838 RepID=A0ABT4KM69_9HYPH|nr:hypothetical protein [Sinorhizobium psoraleae]MCZ4093056.1 hypothetical protein [Sinorhizobium psoraleae]
MELQKLQVEIQKMQMDGAIKMQTAKQNAEIQQQQASANRPGSQSAFQQKSELTFSRRQTREWRCRKVGSVVIASMVAGVRVKEATNGTASPSRWLSQMDLVSQSCVADRAN